ncbi:hypothetical protein OY671_004629 [Metschnikowia pulcherrima]|nr:hypothetical protein OY671_004629 [Metschnikowia pulcherrima]
MSFMEKSRGQSIDIVEFLDESRDTIVWRFPRQGNEIKNQAKLVVREGQSAVFVSEGRLADVFGPGTYTLETQNSPISSTSQGWKHGFSSPFKAEVYFVTTRQLTDLTWGTQNPVISRDPELGAVRSRAFGTYASQVVDPAASSRQLVGTDPQFRTDEIGDYFRRLVVGQLGPALAEAGVAAVDLAANQGQIATRLAGQLSEDSSEYGIAVRRFVLENVSFPPEVEAALDKRTQMAVVGNLDQYTRFQAANAIETAAGNTGGAGDGSGLGAGMGLGAAMGQQLAQSLGTPSAPQAPAAPAGPPPSPAAESPWYWAVDGAQAGPGTTADLAGHVRSGASTRGSLVWQQGMDAWTPAGQVPALAPLDTQGESVRTRCDACGSQLAYAPGTQHSRCVACGGTVDIVHAAGDAVDEHSFDAWAAAQGGVRAGLLDARTLVCDGCGATTQGTDSSVACRFCGGHLVVAAEADGLVQPEAVVPFGVEQAQAREAFRRWVRSRWFAPGESKKVGDTESSHGSYVPHWTFDARTSSAYTGQRGDAYYVTVKQGDQERQERRVSWTYVAGHVERDFDDVLVPASSQVAERDLARLGPWPLAQAVPFRAEYLAGFAAARYEVEPPVGLERAQQQMAPVIRRDVERDIGGDEQRVASVRTAYADVMFKLVLSPSWVATYVYAGRQWQVMVNANTGQVVGRRPYSVGKIVLAVVAGSLVVAALVWWYSRSQT